LTAATDNVAVATYEVLKNDVVIGTTATTSFEVIELTPDTIYSITVKALDAAGNKSAASAALSVTTEALDTTAPSVPTELVASGITETSFTVNWTASTDNVSVKLYEIFLDNVKIATASLTSYTVTGLTEGTDYVLTIKAVDESDNVSTASAPLNVKTIIIDTTAPSAPTGLASSEVTTTGLKLSWTASTDDVGVTGYQVFKDGELIGTSLTTSFDVSGLTDGTSYSFTVKALDEADNVSVASDALAVITVALDKEAPTAPTGLTTSALTATGVTVSWTASTDNVAVTEYEVFRNGTSVGKTASTSLAVTGLTSGVASAFTVQAADAAGNKSATSAPVSVTTLDNVPPSIPAGLTSSNITTTSFRLTWTASTDNVAVKSYNVYRNGSYVVTVTSPAYNFTGLTASTSYKVSVLATDTTNNKSVQSPQLTVQTLSSGADTLAPTAPTGVNSSNVANTTLTLTWTASTDNVAVTNYEVYRSTTLIGTSATTTFNVTGLVSSTAYSFTVRALDAAGNKSTASTVHTVTTAAFVGPDTVAPSVPTNLTSSNITSSGFRVSWTASTDNAGVTGYNVYRNGSFITSTTATTYNFTSLAANTTFNITVLAYDATKNRSAQSAPLAVKTLASGADTVAPTVPANLASSAITTTSFTLSWTAATDNVAVTGYEVYIGSTLKGTSATTSFNVTGLTASTAYAMKVVAYDAAGNKSVASTVLNVTTSSVSGSDTQVPTVPTGLTSSNITTTGFKVTWTASTDNVGVKNYNVYRNGTYIATTGVTNYVFTGLAANTSYAITVLALDAAKNRSAVSAPLTVTTLSN
jgi:chitodextrinase